MDIKPKNEIGELERERKALIQQFSKKTNELNTIKTNIVRIDGIINWITEKEKKFKDEEMKKKMEPKIKMEEKKDGKTE